MILTNKQRLPFSWPQVKQAKSAADSHHPAKSKLERCQHRIMTVRTNTSLWYDRTASSKTQDKVRRHKTRFEDASTYNNRYLIIENRLFKTPQTIICVDSITDVTRGDIVKPPGDKCERNTNKLQRGDGDKQLSVVWSTPMITCTNITRGICSYSDIAQKHLKSPHR